MIPTITTGLLAPATLLLFAVTGCFRAAVALAPEKEARASTSRPPIWPIALSSRLCPMVGTPHWDPKFEEALEYQWKTLERCSGTKIDRNDPDYTYALGQETLEGDKRACWNSPVVPHNFEGFFLNMGDMLVKAGSPDTARTIYANARLSATYDEWPYRELLEERIRDADANVLAFRYPSAGAKTQTIMVTSTFACVACHQR